jgi:hypothetical protein
MQADALIDKPPHIQRLNDLLLQLTSHANATV